MLVIFDCFGHFIDQKMVENVKNIPEFLTNVKIIENNYQFSTYTGKFQSFGKIFGKTFGKFWFFRYIFAKFYTGKPG